MRPLDEKTKLFMKFFASQGATFIDAETGEKIELEGE